MPFPLIKTTLRSKFPFFRRGAQIAGEEVVSASRSRSEFPFFRRGGFSHKYKLMRKDGVVSGDTAQCYFEEILPCVANTTPPAIAGTPSTRRGIFEICLPTLPRRPSVATPSKKGEFCPAFDLNFPSTGWRI